MLRDKYTDLEARKIVLNSCGQVCPGIHQQEIETKANEMGLTLTEMQMVKIANFVSFKSPEDQICWTYLAQAIYKVTQ